MPCNKTRTRGPKTRRLRRYSIANACHVIIHEIGDQRQGDFMGNWITNACHVIRHELGDQRQGEFIDNCIAIACHVIRHELKSQL
jgi:hypothetical protein